MKKLLVVVVVSLCAAALSADTCGCGVATPSDPRCAAETLATAAEHAQAPVVQSDPAMQMLLVLAMLLLPPALIVRYVVTHTRSRLLGRRGGFREQVALAEVARQ